MTDFLSEFCQVFINFLTVKTLNTLIKPIFLLDQVKQLHAHLFETSF